MRARAGLQACLLASLTLIASSAAGAETADEIQARAIVEDGYRLLDGKNAAGALDRFQQAFARTKSPHLHFNIGQALVELAGREAEAHEEFAAYLDEAPDAKAELRAEATRQLGLLRVKIALLSINTQPAAVAVSVDGKARGTTPLPRPLAMVPGTREIGLSKPGFNPISEMTTVAAGEEQSKSYELSPLAIASPPPPRPPSPPPPPEASRVARVAGLVTVGAGVVLGVTGFFVYRAGASKLDSIMQSAKQNTPYDESDGSYETLGKTGIGLMVAGGAAVATGAVLYFVNRDRSTAAHEAIRPGLSLGYIPGVGGQVQVGGRF